jgi:hypothetical protein
MFFLVFDIAPLVKNWPPILGRIVVITVVMAAMSPYIILELFWPRSFQTIERDESIDYEFASPEYGKMFATLNARFVLTKGVIQSDDREPNRMR